MSDESGPDLKHCKAQHVQKPEPCTERERLFGILQRVSLDHTVCSGILKKRYSDFVVNEIDLQGNVLHLTSTNAPVEDLRSGEKCENPEPDFQSLAGLLPSDTVAKLIEIYEQKQESLVEIEPVANKEERTKIHTAVRENLSGAFGSETVDGKIRIFPLKSHAFAQDKRNDIRHLKNKQITKFLLLKENRDTVECLQYISSLLKAPFRNFSFAGTKDKRAITVQAVTAYGIIPKRLEGINKILKNAKVGNYSTTSEPLKLGDLQGNRFTIAIREIKIEVNAKPELEHMLNSLSERGFINYFGLQRFGTGSVSTNVIGEAILRQNWKEAVHLIMSSHEPSDIRYVEMRNDWLRDGEKNEFLQLIPKRLVAESAIANYFLSNPDSQNNYLGAFERIPRELRLLYLHSYQSYVWNVAASNRIAMDRTRAIPGDLVFPRTTGESPIVVDAENASNYSIFDVMLPLPGHSVIYPQIESVFAVYANCKDLFKQSQNSLLNSLTGSYRKLVQTPANLQFSYKTYHDSDEKLVCSDFDALSEQQIQVTCATNDTKLVQPPNPISLIDNQDKEDKPKLQALILSFDLPTSSYATMCLRECIELLS